MTNIIVVDDHSVFRMGLLSILRSDPRFNVEGDYKSFNLLQPLVNNLNAHVILIDISVNKEAGFDVPQFLKTTNPSIKVIIVTYVKEEFYILNAVEGGVDGYIHKDSEPDEIKLGIAKVVAGEKFYSREISNILVQNFQKKTYRGLPFLTSKEKEIIRFIMDGHSSKQIASFLDVSPRTIDTHRANILAKFNLKNTSELISKIAEHKISL
jgi:DNA-binding NarL/FixJ family response regulator